MGGLGWGGGSDPLDPPPLGIGLVCIDLPLQSQGASHSLTRFIADAGYIDTVIDHGIFHERWFLARLSEFCE